MMTTLTLAELKNRPQWVCWICEEKDGRKAKTPMNPHNGFNAKVNARSTWGTYEECVVAKEQYNFDGVGLILTDGICGIDIDAVNHNSDMAQENPLANEICDFFADTYMEYSPSGKGIHILGLCDIKKLPFIVNEGNKLKLSTQYYLKNARDNIEIYFSDVTNRFFTFTEDNFGTDIFADITEKINRFMSEYMKKNNTKKEVKEMNKLKLIEILAKARNAENGAKFTKLYDDGNISDYNDDASRADLALCDMLAYWCDYDRGMVDELFRASKLYREKWEREDYRESILDKACDVIELTDATQLPSGGNKKPELTLFALENWLSQQQIVLKSNAITHEIEVSGLDEVYNPQTIVEQMHIILHDSLKKVYKCSMGLVEKLLSVIAQKNTYNPVLEMLAKEEAWDGKDRLNDLYHIIRIDDADTFSKTLVHKWLLMAIAMAKNKYTNPYGADGILVFQGPQGIGKTSLCRKLGVEPELTKTGMYIDSNDKDTIIRSTSCWIAELGELETTLRSDMARLKGFITAETDRYRVPYGRGDVFYPRHTCFIATCNTEEFLADESGSRRFWVVPCKERFDLTALNDFNVMQLWKQIEQELNQYPYSTENYSSYQNCFRLTPEEQRMLAERNSIFNRKVKAQKEIEDILAMASNNPSLYEYRWCTATQFKAEYSVLNRYSSENIGRALHAIGLEEKSLRINGSKSVSKGCRYLPIPKKYGSEFVVTSDSTEEVF